jgi:3-hydroxy-9,10-secoandrosta-1,3,5(10)-triene-9,17-dione monooxygenase reductase component
LEVQPHLDGHVDATAFRKVLGHFCTGVTVVTAASPAGPVGFACQSFAALSLEPPLVLFCPSRASTTWRAIHSVGAFCVNILSAEQQEISRVFGTAGADKFAGIGWSPGPHGTPILDGVLTWLACVVEMVHEAGDHYVVVGRVKTLGEYRDGRPLLFYRGRYAVTEATEGPPEVVDTLLAWPRPADRT